MIGEHTFELDAHYLSPNARAFGVKVEVTYDVSVYLDSQGDIDMDKVTPDSVTLTVGGTIGEKLAWGEVTGALRSNILLWTESLGLEQLGITDAEAREALVEEDDWAAHEREHAAGRV